MNTNTNKTNAAHFEGILMRAAGNMMLAAGAGLGGLIIVPTLSILAFVFTVVGIGVAAVPFVNLFGILAIPYFVLGFKVTGLVQILVGMATGVSLIAAGLLSGYGVKKYFQCVKYVFGGRTVQ